MHQHLVVDNGDTYPIDDTQFEELRSKNFVGVDVVVSYYKSIEGYVRHSSDAQAPIQLHCVAPFSAGQKAFVVENDQCYQFTLIDHPEYLTEKFVFAIIDGLVVSLGHSSSLDPR